MSESAEISSQRSIDSIHSRESIARRSFAEGRPSVAIGSNQRRQGIYWLGTIPRDSWDGVTLPEGIVWAKGQPELGADGYKHWQLVFGLCRKGSLAAVRNYWSPIVGHWELTRSSAAEQYVWKTDSRDGEQFELGERPFNRSSSTDWDSIRAAALAGDLSEVPSDVFIRYYGSLVRIGADHDVPTAMVRCCTVLWGKTGSGKSRRAFTEAGELCYVKDPRSKFWCGYRGESCVIIDEFRGGIDIAHILRWLDRYPVRVETKGGSRPLAASRFWITSNLHPRMWYPELDLDSYAALARRLVIEEIILEE